MHFDGQHVFFMQVSGVKHWKIGMRPAWNAAPTNMTESQLKSANVEAFLQEISVAIPAAEDCDVQEFTLHPGDVLYMPPGFWHQGSTSDSHSLHYTLTFMPLTPWNLLVGVMRQKYFENENLRADIRYLADKEDDSLSMCVEAALSELRSAIGEKHPAEVLEWYQRILRAGDPLKGYLLQP